jgi:PAS domain S-box-containing protein
VQQDITERKQAEVALREMAHRLEVAAQAYRQVIDNSLDVICTMDEEGVFVQVSAASEKVWGYKPDELIGQMYIDLVHPEDRPNTREVATKIMSGIPVRDFENRYARKDGSEANIMWSANWSREDRTMFCVARDINEIKVAEQALRHTEEQLRQSQKMEAIGQLAGGIAHDFNNLLTVISGYGELSARKLKAEDPLRLNLEEIKKAGDRAASLTRQLLAFSRRQILQPKVLDLNQVVLDLEKMLGRLIGEDVEMRTNLAPSLGSVKADPGQIEQVLMNLAVNARDAMPQGGKLTIGTENVYLDPDYASHHLAVTPGPYILLAVSDTGHGMTEETKSRIFEPFFTTKEQGKGTGLGLSTVYGIVKQSGGNIWVYSEPGAGTTFKIYLPRTDEGAGEYVRGLPATEVLKGTETVLLVEDEELVRNLVRHVLEDAGYKLLEATNGGAGLQLCDQYEAPIHLLLTDVVMPEMSGQQLAERLRKTRPGMAVLYMSGYTEDTIVHHGVLDEDVSFIEKPFNPDALARKVREVIDASLIMPQQCFDEGARVRTRQ